MQLHGTYRRKDRIYTEDIFYGTGKKLSEATDAEKEADLKVSPSIMTAWKNTISTTHPMHDVSYYVGHGLFDNMIIGVLLGTESSLS